MRHVFNLLCLAVAGFAVFIAVAACGSSDKNNAAAGNSGARALKMAQCMRTHGVPNFPDPSQGSAGFQVQATQNGSGQTVVINGVSVNAPAFQKASSDCQKDQPQGGVVSSRTLAGAKAQALKMAQCMRAHGITNFPDPKVTTGPGGHGIGVQIGIGAGGAGGMNPQSPAFQSASKLCGGPGSAHPMALAKTSGPTSNS